MGCIVLPEIISREDPIYPKAARDAKLEGKVIVQSTVAVTGQLEDIKVVTSSNPGQGFEEAAIEALKQWRCKPGSLKGEPVPVIWTNKIDFRLD
jgi:protein TonB